MPGFSDVGGPIFWFGTIIASVATVWYQREENIDRLMILSTGVSLLYKHFFSRKPLISD